MKTYRWKAREARTAPSSRQSGFSRYANLSDTNSYTATGPRSQRVWLLRTPGYNEQGFFCLKKENFDYHQCLKSLATSINISCLRKQRAELLVTKNSIVSRVRWLLYMLQAVIFQDRNEMFLWLGRLRIKTTYDSDATITKKQNHVIVNKNLLTSAKSPKRATDVHLHPCKARDSCALTPSSQWNTKQFFVNYPVKIRTLGHPSNTMVRQMFH